MKTFIVKLIFNVSVENANDRSEFDEQVRLINARNAEEAFYKARQLGKNEESSFTNSASLRLSWRFIDVLDIYSLDEVSDGQQIYSSTHKTGDSDSYIHYIRQKSMELQVKNLTFA